MKLTASKNLMILPLIALLAIWAANCSKDDKSSNPNDSNGIAHLDLRGDCMGHISAAETDSGYMVLEVDGNDLHIHHMDAYYNCCFDYMVDYRIENFNITASEADIGDMHCLCDCYFNLSSILYDLDGGCYSVTLIGIYGDTVGVDTVSIGR